MNLKKHIPNLFTLGNLFCGCLALIVIFSYDPYHGRFLDSNINMLLLLFLFCLFFDLLDGIIARWLGVSSSVGKQLDSLADMVSFGVVPGFIMSMMLGQISLNYYFALFGISIVLFSALRLAKFNVDSEQTYYFKGLPTPANAVFLFSLFWIIQQKGCLVSIEYDIYILILITILSCYLLVSNIPLFSLKFRDFSWKNNHYKFVVLGLAVFGLIFFQISAIPFIILLYIVVSIIFRNKIINE